MGFRGERYSGRTFSKNREEEGYLQNSLGRLRDLFSLSLLGIPSIGSLTGALLNMKALYEID
jgi:hypothetical protein